MCFVTKFILNKTLFYKLKAELYIWVYLKSYTYFTSAKIAQQKWFYHITSCKKLKQKSHFIIKVLSVIEILRG